MKEVGKGTREREERYVSRGTKDCLWLNTPTWPMDKWQCLKIPGETRC